MQDRTESSSEALNYQKHLNAEVLHMHTRKHIIVIGGGVAGMESAIHLCDMGYEVTLVEKQDQLGGHVLKWDFLFPDHRPAYEITNELCPAVEEKANIKLQTEVKNIVKQNGHFEVALSDGEILTADALLVATGFDLFDAHKKEEYGYGIYDNVITAAELEERFQNKIPIRTAAGKKPARVGFVHCVGSRDEKVGNEYCSKVCCVTAVKQAMRVKESLPGCEVFCFYMDLRMFGRYFEDLYREAQEKWGVQFIRGRLSEAAEGIDHRIIVKVEDTLAGRPLRMAVDLLVLLTGFVPSEGTKRMAAMLNLPLGNDRFIRPSDEHLRRNLTPVPGVFVTGASSGPRSISESISDARAAALEIAAWFNHQNQHAVK